MNLDWMRQPATWHPARRPPSGSASRHRCTRCRNGLIANKWPKPLAGSATSRPGIFQALASSSSAPSRWWEIVRRSHGLGPVPAGAAGANRPGFKALVDAGARTGLPVCLQDRRSQLRTVHLRKWCAARHVGHRFKSPSVLSPLIDVAQRDDHEIDAAHVRLDLCTNRIGCSELSFVPNWFYGAPSCNLTGGMIAVNAYSCSIEQAANRSGDDRRRIAVPP
jgi:hypothetical protein